MDNGKSIQTYQDTGCPKRNLSVNAKTNQAECNQQSTKDNDYLDWIEPKVDPQDIETAKCDRNVVH